jgi:hypothetical protein
MEVEEAREDDEQKVALVTRDRTNFGRIPAGIFRFIVWIMEFLDRIIFPAIWT